MAKVTEIEIADAAGTFDAAVKLTRTAADAVRIKGSGLVIGSADDSDEIKLYHDNSDAYLQWDDGILLLSTDEGANTITTIDIRGKGDQIGRMRIRDENNLEYLEIYATRGTGQVKVAGAAPGALRLQQPAQGNIECFTGAAAGERPKFAVYGRDSGDTLRNLQIGMSSTVVDTIDFTNVANYSFTGNIQVSGDIGLAADTDLIQLAANVVTINGDLRVEGLDIGIAADPDLLQLAANALTVNGDIDLSGDLVVDGGDIGITGDTNLLQLAANALTINGDLASDGAAVFNDSAADKDFRIESDTDTHAFFLEGSSGNIGMGIDAPEEKLHVAVSNDHARIILDAYDDGTAYPNLVLRRSKSDTIGTKVETTDGLILGNIQVYGVQNSPAFGLGAQIRISQVGAAGGAAFVPAKMVLEACTDAAVNTDQLALLSDGDISMSGDLAVDGTNIGITADKDLIAMAANVLTINGGITATGDLLVDGTNIGITADANLLTLAANLLTVAGNVTTGAGYNFICGGTGRVRLGEVDAADMDATVGGTERDMVYNTNNNTFYGCTATGAPGGATWVAFH